MDFFVIIFLFRLVVVWGDDLKINLVELKFLLIGYFVIRYIYICEFIERMMLILLRIT